MSWIQQPSDGDEELQALWNRARDPRTGKVDHIIAVHGLHPEGMAAHLHLYETVMRGTTSLPKADREMIALVVSQRNSCGY